MKNQKGNPNQMKPNELRIGNRVEGDHSRVFCSDWGVMSISSIGETKVNGWNEYNRLRPIPLTQELLLKCGFVKTDGFYYTYNCSFTLNHDKFDDGSYNAKSQSYNIARGIKYLHQLQNLYFALTGEELEINL